MEALTALMELSKSDAQHANTAQEIVINALHGQLETGTIITREPLEPEIIPDEKISQSQKNPVENFAVKAKGNQPPLHWNLSRVVPWKPCLTQNMLTTPVATANITIRTN